MGINLLTVVSCVLRQRGGKKYSDCRGYFAPEYIRLSDENCGQVVQCETIEIYVIISRG